MQYTLDKKYPVMNKGFKSYSFCHLVEVKKDTLIVAPTKFNGDREFSKTNEKEISKDILMPNTIVAIHRINMQKSIEGEKLGERELRLAKKQFPELLTSEETC